MAYRWEEPYSSFQLDPNLALSSEDQMFLHSSIAQLRPSIDRNSDLAKFKSTIFANFLSLPTKGSHSLSCFIKGSKRFLYSQSDFAYLLLSYVSKNSFHPSIMKGFYPRRLDQRHQSWLKSCLTTIKRSPRVYLPESGIQGNMSWNLFRKRIQFRCVKNCFQGEQLPAFVWRWCRILGLFAPLVSVWRGATSWFSLELIPLLKRRGLLESISLTVKGWFENSFKEIRFFSSGVKHLRMKSLRSSESVFSMETLFRLISSINCFSLEHAHGALPCKISQKITPIDQISFLTVQMLF